MFKLIKKILGLSSTTAIYSLANWLLMIFVARTYGQVEVVLLGVATAIITPYIFFTKLGLKNVVSNMERVDSGTLQAFFTARSILQIVLLPLVLLLYYFSSPAIVLSFFIAFWFYKCLESVSDFSYGLRLRYSSIHEISISMTLHSFAIVVACFISYVYQLSMASMFCMLIVFRLLILMLFDAKGFLPRINAVILKDALQAIKRYNALGFAVCVITLYNYLPRYASGPLLSQNETAIVVVCTQFLVVFSMLSTAIGQILSTKVRKMKKLMQYDKITLMVNSVVVVSLCCAVIAYLLPLSVYGLVLEYSFGSLYSSEPVYLKLSVMVGAVLFISQILFYFSMALGDKAKILFINLLCATIYMCMVYLLSTQAMIVLNAWLVASLIMALLFVRAVFSKLKGV